MAIVVLYLYSMSGQNVQFSKKSRHVPVRHLHKDVELQILQYIESNRVAVGAKLPTESEFCRLFNVSRSTVRHALAQLEKAGLISRVQGSGTFLSDPSQASG